MVGAFLGAGFVAGQSALVIASVEHRPAIAATLESLSFSLDRLRTTGRLIFLDANVTLDSVMIHDSPDPVRFESVVGSAIGHCGAANPCGLRAYDDMSDLLSRRNLLPAATRLESLWNRLLASHRCDLLCGHSVGAGLQVRSKQSLCASHGYVLADNGMPHPVRGE